MVTPDLDLAIAWLSAHGWLRAEVNELAAEVTLVLGNIGVERRG